MGAAPVEPARPPAGDGALIAYLVHAVIVLGERRLKRILSSYADYYSGARTHLSLYKDAPEG